LPRRSGIACFDRFYRVLGTAADGSGLGLAIVREIVTQHEALLRIARTRTLRAQLSRGR